MSDVRDTRVAAMKRGFNARPIQREAIERIARIMGQNSASAAALREADTYGGDVRFWQTRDAIVVEKVA